MTDKVNYSLLSTEELIKKIALNSDEKALIHFLSKRYLLTLDKQNYLLPTYLSKLKLKNFRPFVSIYKYDKTTELKIELTYDKIHRKFTVFEPQVKNEDEKGPFCNNQYYELYNKIISVKESKKIDSSIKLEKEIGKILKNIIKKHLHFSFLETLRDLSVYYRTPYTIKNETIIVKKPQWMKGKRDFRKWLEENITNEEGKIILSKEEIQKKIYDKYGYPVMKSLDEGNGISVEIVNVEDLEEKIDRPKDFIHMIATEKSSKINLLQPGIKKLGKENIYRLVVRILESWINEENKDSNIVREYGLSKATYSRFAGRKWDREKFENAPFLLKNVFGFFSSNPYFTELIAKKGYSEIVKRILNIN